jgi:glycosyltransferase involved in cell wall biosynthesis
MFGRRSYPSPLMEVSVVICAYTLRRYEDLRAAVGSALAQDPTPLEVLVISDGNDELLERARTDLTDARVLANRLTPGLSGARNTAIAEARGAIVAFLDDDAEAQPGWLAGLVAPYADEAVLGVGGFIEASWDAGRPGWFPPEFDWIVGCSYVGQPAALAPVRNLIGANMSARRDVLAALGGFTTSLGRVGAGVTGNEETDLCIRGLQRWPGRRWMLSPSARVRHRVPADRGRWKYFVRRCWGEGQSKSAMVGDVGTSEGLSSERSYATRTLPRGVVRHARHDPRRSGAIVVGLAVTTASYAVGTVRSRRASRSAPTATLPSD